MIIEGQIKVEVSINGIEVPLGPTTLESLAVIQSTQQLVPTLELDFYDHDRLFSNSVLSDGAPISVLIDPQVGNRPTSPSMFRLFNINGLKPTPVGHKIQLSGYLDQPRLFREVQRDVIDGTSANVVQQIAGKLGIPVDADPTSDKMKWLPNNKTMGQYLRYAMDHAHAGGGATMQLAMTLINGIGTLRYKDAFKQATTAPSSVLKSESLNMDLSSPTIEEYSFRSHGGTLNAFTGYSSEVIQPALAGVMDVFKNVDVLKSVASMNMSAGLHKLFETAFTRRELFPPQQGNTHDNYAKAKNANLRSKATFSGHIHVMTRNYVPIALLDSMEVQIASGYENEIDDVLSGKYVLIGRTQYVRGQWYRERLHGTNQGSGAASPNSK